MPNDKRRIPLPAADGDHPVVVSLEDSDAIMKGSSDVDSIQRLEAIATNEAARKLCDGWIKSGPDDIGAPEELANDRLGPLIRFGIKFRHFGLCESRNDYLRATSLRFFDDEIALRLGRRVPTEVVDYRV